LKSIYRKDYDPKKVEPFREAYNEKSMSKFLPFAGVSDYRDKFVNWGFNPVSALKPPAHPTVIKELPFVGKSEYKNHYLGKPADKDDGREKLLAVSRYG